MSVKGEEKFIVLIAQYAVQFTEHKYPFNCSKNFRRSLWGSCAMALEFIYTTTTNVYAGCKIKKKKMREAIREGTVRKLT